jgi:hypothetical protein
MVANIRDTGNQNIISSKLLKNKDKMKVFSWIKAQGSLK